MTEKNHSHSKYSLIEDLKQAHSQDENITHWLKNREGLKGNTPEIIEFAYDLQAGSYAKNALQDRDRIQLYASELAEVLDRYVERNDCLLDIGSGELTTLSILLNQMKTKPEKVFAFDISLSRILKGLSFAQAELLSDFKRINPFVAEIGSIPFGDNAISVTTSNHSLEPNGQMASRLLDELLRVTEKKLILFEPCYERNSKAGKDRMDELGYIKGIESLFIQKGAKIEEVIEVEHISNPLNPTFCFVVSPPESSAVSSSFGKFTAPGTNFELEQRASYYFSEQYSLYFPIIESIPILRIEKSVFASALSKQNIS